MQCIGHFKLLFSLLQMDGAPQLQEAALEAISTVVSNKECVNDIASSEVMPDLLLLIHSIPNGK